MPPTIAQFRAWLEQAVFEAAKEPCAEADLPRLTTMKLCEIAHYAGALHGLDMAINEVKTTPLPAGRNTAAAWYAALCRAAARIKKLKDTHP